MPRQQKKIGWQPERSVRISNHLSVSEWDAVLDAAYRLGLEKSHQTARIIAEDEYAFDIFYDDEFQFAADIIRVVAQRGIVLTEEQLVMPIGGIAEEVLLAFDDGFWMGRSEKPKKTEAKQLKLKV